jgi:hypothetical protein
MSWRVTEQKLKVVKEALLILALVVGGIWAIYRFVVLESASAKLEYEKALSTSKAFGIQVQLETTSFVAGSCKLFGNIKLQNVGTMLVVVQIDKAPPIAVAAVKMASDGHFVDLASQKTFWIDDTDRHPAKNVSVVPGRTVTLPFAAEVDEPGLYMLRFKAPVHFQGSAGIQGKVWTERKIFRACAPEPAA